MDMEDPRVWATARLPLGFRGPVKVRKTDLSPNRSEGFGSHGLESASLKYEIIRRCIPDFNKLASEARDHIIASTSIRSYQKDDSITSKDEEGNHIFFLSKGKCRFFGAGFIGDGCFKSGVKNRWFGLELIQQVGFRNKYLHTVRACGDCTCLLFEGAVLQNKLPNRIYMKIASFYQGETESGPVKTRLSIRSRSSSGTYSSPARKEMIKDPSPLTDLDIRGSDIVPRVLRKNPSCTSIMAGGATTTSNSPLKKAQKLGLPALDLQDLRHSLATVKHLRRNKEALIKFVKGESRLRLLPVSLQGSPMTSRTSTPVTRKMTPNHSLKTSRRSMSQFDALSPLKRAGGRATTRETLERSPSRSILTRRPSFERLRETSKPRKRVQFNLTQTFGDVKLDSDLASLDDNQVRLIRPINRGIY